MAKSKNPSAEAASKLQKQLTTLFPNVKFSVTSKTYSGDSFDVSWHFGPTGKDVLELLSLREFGQDEGMPDKYNNIGVAEGLKNDKYALYYRYCECLDADNLLREDLVLIYLQIAVIRGWELFDNNGNIDYTPDGVWTGANNSASYVYHRIVSECSFISDNVELLECKWCDYEYNGKRWYEPYTIIYKDLNTGKIYDAKAGEIDPYTIEEPQLNNQEIHIINYNEKCFVVYGETFSIKDTLSNLNGRFNRNLKHPETGERLAGWIFSLKRKVAVIDAINKLN